MNDVQPVMALEPTVELSVVVPVYRCRGSLRELHRRLTAVLPTLTADYEIVFVDDECPENSWEEIAKIAFADRHVRGIRLSRNFGQAIAVAAGLSESAGRRVIVMDGDLQDPPEAIPILWEAAEAGAPLVYGKRRSDHQSAARLNAGKFYFLFLKLISGRDIDPCYGTFTLLSREIVDAYLQFAEPNRHYLFILYWLGCSGVEVEYNRDKREIGTSSYQLWRLLRHSYQGILFYSQSLQFILMALVLAMGVSAFGLLGAAMLGFGPASIVGVVLMALFGVLLAAAIGVLGIFAAQIFDYAKRRPLFVVLKRTLPPLSNH